MSRLCLPLALVLALTLSASGAEPTTVKLWPGKAPGETKDLGPEQLTLPKNDKDVKRLANVSEPTITIYSPSREKANGTAVVVAPGGAYRILAIEHEGTQVCEWLNSIGVTAALVKYRVPKRSGQMPDNLAMIQDAQRAIALVRSKHKELGIDPTRVGMLGFSAGGHLTACTALTKKRMYDSVDKADTISSPEPNFAILIYPAYLTDKAGKLAPELVVKPDSPPMFLAYSSNDAVTNEGSPALYLALTKNKVPVEMHAYATGGHGYGMRKTGTPSASWPARAADWMKTRGLLAPSKK